ncbi:MAG: hypothetical protein CSA34_01525 [Desulfobulbus propionicus]|nr:MAG: hypothetical protein CSA34_01525 [Desulfobulbus propionicus]
MIRYNLHVAIIALFCCLAGPVLAAEPLIISNIKFTALDADNEWISFQLNGSYTPKPFTIKGERPRIVFDFFDVGVASTVPSLTNTHGRLVRRIRVGVHKGSSPKARIVVDLQPNSKVAFEMQADPRKKQLNVHLFNPEAMPNPADVPEYSEETAPSVGDSPGQQPAPDAKIDTSASKGTPAAEPEGTAKETTAPAVSAGAAEQQATKPADTVHNDKAQPFLESVRFDDSSSKGEMVLFKLNDFYPPVVFGIEEDSPRVVCDFKDTTVSAKVKGTIAADGHYVRSIRVGQHASPQKVRVVLDLEPHHNYDLQQVFFREDNLFVIIVNTIKELPPASAKSKGQAE